MVDLAHELIYRSADREEGADAIVYQGQKITYASLASEVEITARALLNVGLGRSERLAVYLEKRPETVVALFAAVAAGGVFVPVNPLLKSDQVTYILSDCNVRVLVTSAHRLQLLTPVLSRCHDLHTVVVVGKKEALPIIMGLTIIFWEDLCKPVGITKSHPIIDSDIAAILYTSGSTGKPKGVVLSHRNLIAGAKSVCQYLENNSHDRILSVLPLSFDYGLSQITTAFYIGATSVLINYLLPRDIIGTTETENITGLAAV
ncbi:MAG: AMP-binding protein, partial [Nitrosomonas sp.]|nr:AMP-binding protein [Nitrosomonas sp.]